MFNAASVQSISNVASVQGISNSVSAQRMSNTASVQRLSNTASVQRMSNTASVQRFSNKVSVRSTWSHDPLDHKKSLKIYLSVEQHLFTIIFTFKCLLVTPDFIVLLFKATRFTQ